MVASRFVITDIVEGGCVAILTVVVTTITGCVTTGITQDVAMCVDITTITTMIITIDVISCLSRMCKETGRVYGF